MVIIPVTETSVLPVLRAFQVLGDLRNHGLALVPDSQRFARRDV